MTAAVEALRDLWEEADDHVTSDQFRTGLADALMKFCRGLFATTNLIYLSRQIPLLRERRLIVLLSGGEALVCRVGGAAGGRGMMRMPGVAMPWLVGYYGVFQAGHVVFNVVYLSVATGRGLASAGDRVLDRHRPDRYSDRPAGALLRGGVLWRTAPGAVGGARLAGDVHVHHLRLQLHGGRHRGLGHSIPSSTSC